MMLLSSLVSSLGLPAAAVAVVAAVGCGRWTRWRCGKSYEGNKSNKTERDGATPVSCWLEHQRGGGRTGKRDRETERQRVSEREGERLSGCEVVRSRNDSRSGALLCIVIFNMDIASNTKHA
jgi:hypothetical protein